MIDVLIKLALMDGLKYIRDNRKLSNKYPKALSDYFSKISGVDLIDEIKIIMNGHFTSSKLAHLVVEFLSSDFCKVVDEYYNGKSQSINIDNNSNLGRGLLNMLENSTYNEISENISREIYKTYNGEIIIIESPIDLKLDLKTEIRKKFQENKTPSFVVFKVNGDILGGIKTYIDGKIHDNSWVQRVEKMEYIGT